MKTSRRALIFCLPAAVLLPSMGLAAGKPSTASPEPNVRIGTAAVPIVANNRVVNYVFVSVKVNLTPKADSVKLREKEPYFRDRMVHAAHKNDLAVAGRTDTIDTAKFNTVMMKEFSAITGPGMIASIEILMQNPKRHQR